MFHKTTDRLIDTFLFLIASTYILQQNDHAHGKGLLSIPVHKQTLPGPQFYTNNSRLWFAMEIQRTNKKKYVCNRLTKVSNNIKLYIALFAFIFNIKLIGRFKHICIKNTSNIFIEWPTEDNFYMHTASR